MLAPKYLLSVNIVFDNTHPNNILINVNSYLKLTHSPLSRCIKGEKSVLTILGSSDNEAPKIFVSSGYLTAVDC